MIVAKFNEISNQVDGKYTCKDSKYSSGMGSRMLVTEHVLKVEYKSVFIEVKYIFGNSNIAEAISIIKGNCKLFPFHLTTKSHIQRLFSRYKQPWKVKSSDKSVVLFIENIMETVGFNKIAEETSFEPIIECNDDGGQYSIKTRFYLGFDNKEDTLLPLINLYKGFIDYALT